MRATKSGTSMLPQIDFFAPNPRRKTNPSHERKTGSARINGTTALMGQERGCCTPPRSRTCKKPTENEEGMSQKKEHRLMIRLKRIYNF
jgi:hypothetical protein